MDGIGKLEPSESDDQTVLPRHVKRALDYLNSNLAEKITLAELASACAAAELPSLKQFQRFVGVPPLAYLRHRDERTRVIVRLVDVAADRHVWGDSFDGSVNDPFELEDRVVDGVLCGVVSRITDAEIERVHNKAPTDLGTRDLALQALPLILGTSVPNARRAMPWPS